MRKFQVGDTVLITRFGPLTIESGEQNGAVGCIGKIVDNTSYLQVKPVDGTYVKAYFFWHCLPEELELLEEANGN